MRPSQRERILDAAIRVVERTGVTGVTFDGCALSGVRASGSKFGRAKLLRADFSGAELASARGLTQAQLNTACGDGSTLLPTGLTIPAC
mgnify:CR=1 FL=1